MTALKFQLISFSTVIFQRYSYRVSQCLHKGGLCLHKLVIAVQREAELTINMKNVDIANYVFHS